VNPNRSGPSQLVPRSLIFALDPVDDGSGEQQQEDLQNDGERQDVGEERPGEYGDSERVYVAARVGRVLCHGEQVGAEKDCSHRRRECGVDPVLEIPSALFAAADAIH
jgi:hypothetical protein